MARSRQPSEPEASAEAPTVEIMVPNAAEIDLAAARLKVEQLQAELDGTRAGIAEAVTEATAALKAERDDLLERLRAKPKPVAELPPPTTPPPTPDDWIDEHVQRFVVELRALGATVDQGRQAIYRRAFKNLIEGRQPKPRRLPGPNRRPRG